MGQNPTQEGLLKAEQQFPGLERWLEGYTAKPPRGIQAP